ncbi:ThiS family protein [Peptococcaceae bacterium CEB3]|nr:ThiS family protein [Peptococcaceae bacterium CEB3]
MRVTVKLFATLREGRFKAVTWDLPEGTEVGEILRRLNIKQEEVSILLVNGREAKVCQVLSEGDAVSAFPPIGGG